MRVSWELEGRTPPWHCSPWTLSPRTARKAGIRAPFYIRESPGGEVGIALQFIVKGPIPERWGCPIPEPPSLGVQPGLQGTDGLGRGRGETYKS